MSQDQGQGAAAQSPDAKDSSPLSVSQAMSLARGALEAVVVRLVGEVSEVSDKPGYKAVYFTVKDEHASLPCIMWLKRYQAADAPLHVGALVELTGRFTLYAAKGRMNFEVLTLNLAGEGQLRLQVANLARELERMGLMDPARKRPLPAYPERIGLVTSPRGKVVHDVLRTLRRRYPLARVLFAGVPVEGPSAANALVDGLAKVVFSGAEVVLLVRGGGTFEDYMPFNDRRLARTIAACPVPVVTGIGHEPDTTIADMVADLRASTPTAAAEKAAPPREQLAVQLDSLARSMGAAETRRLDQAARRLERISSLTLFREPERLFDEEALALDDLSGRLARALPDTLRESRHRLGLLSEAIGRMLPAALAPSAARVEYARGRLAARASVGLDRFRAALDADERRLIGAGGRMTDRHRRNVAVAAARLHDLSPLTVISRGYAVARDNAGEVVRSIDQAPVGSALVVAVSDGEIDCTVNNTRRIISAVEDWREDE